MQVQDTIVGSHQRALGFVPFLGGIYRRKGCAVVPGYQPRADRAAVRRLLARTRRSSFCSRARSATSRRRIWVQVLGGFITDVATNPLRVVRTRLVRSTCTSRQR